VFDAHDSGCRALDGLKAVRFGVYHSTVDGVLYEHLGYSYDLIRWRFRCDLDQDASQAAVTHLPDDSWLVAYEHSVRADHRWINLRFRWYADDSAMLTCTPTRQYDAPLTLARTAEGTPSFCRVNWHGSIANSSVQMGLHYLRDSIHVDRQAWATLANFKRLSNEKASRYDALFADIGFAGNFGDRCDAFAFKGASYIIWEAQRDALQFDTWRTFLYSRATGQADPLAMRTPGDSKAVGNPSLTSVMIVGHPYLFITQFVFGRGRRPR
jgi:hypothetical protein